MSHLAAPGLCRRTPQVPLVRRLANALVIAASHALLGFTAGVLLTIALRTIP
jgi:hypothetical protein